MLALLIKPWGWPCMISNRHAHMSLLIPACTMRGALKRHTTLLSRYMLLRCLKLCYNSKFSNMPCFLLQAAYGQSTLTITSFFTYVGLGLGFLGSSLALPFGLYVLICQRTTEKYVQVRPSHFVNLPPIRHCLCLIFLGFGADVN